MSRHKPLPFTCLSLIFGFSGVLMLTALIIISSQLSFSSEVVAYVDNLNGDRDIFLLDLRHNLTVNLTQHPADDSAPVWSPDGTQLIFHSNRNEQSGLYMMSASGRHLYLLIADNANYPAWSPDGTQIAFRSNRDGNQELYTIQTDGTNLRRLTHQIASDNLPAWSPDSTQIAFYSNLSGNGDVYLINADGTNMRQLTTHRNEDTYPRWSPDGTQIAFSSDRADEITYQIYLYNLGEASIELLTVDNLINSHSPQWLPNGEEIIFQSLGGSYRYTRLTYRMTLRDRVLRPLTTTNAYLEMLAWRP